jgi:hypothetical protein
MAAGIALWLAGTSPLRGIMCRHPVGGPAPIAHLRKEPGKGALRWALKRMMQELREPSRAAFWSHNNSPTVMLVLALRLHLAEGSRGGLGGSSHWQTNK